jgi:hypothetical protein
MTVATQIMWGQPPRLSGPGEARPLRAVLM